jgi:hypothetical protein
MYARNPFTGTLGRCIDEATRTVIVAAVKPRTMTFEGCGVTTRVCDSHATELITYYGALTDAPPEMPPIIMRPVEQLLPDMDQPDLVVDDGKTDENGVAVSYNAVPRRRTW